MGEVKLTMRSDNMAAVSKRLFYGMVTLMCGALAPSTEWRRRSVRGPGARHCHGCRHRRNRRESVH
jgi:hypothetical protein